MTRTQYQQNLDTLKRYVVEMGNRSYEAIVDSMQSLNSIDVELAAKVIQGDDVINEYELEIERFVTQLIARESPTAGDMRFVISCFKIAIDLERMSDLAVDIANISKCIEQEHTKPLANILKMGEIGELMLQQSIIAFENLDEKMAHSTALMDDQIDQLFYQSQKELIEMMAEDRSIINNASYLLFVLRYLERIGDHACNICESVVYIASGERAELN